MSGALRSLLLTLSVLLAVSTQLCLANVSNDTDCQPEIPPEIGPNANATMVALQMHQWIWIENISSPDWAPRTEAGGLVYEFLRPGFVRHLRLPVFNYRILSAYVNVSYVTNGETLCTAALTEYRNRTSGSISRVSCNRICHANFTSLGTQANLPLMVFEDWTTLTRYNEYLAFDAVDPDSRASYKCMGHFKWEPIRSLSHLMSGETQCSAGDECLFNYDTSLHLVDGGCKNNFREYSWCVSDLELCSYNMDGDCPVCCRGDLCNLEMAQKVYKRWLDKGATTSSASSLWMLTACALGILWLRFQY